MGAFIQNPRQYPRIQARYRVVVSHGGAGWSAETADLSVNGCQIISSRPMRKGEAAKLVIEAPQLTQPLSVFGSVAWVNDQARIRVGLTFAERQPDGDPAAWFKRLVANQPGIEGALRRVPERLPVETKLFLRPPPQFIFDFGPDEVAFLRLLGDGMTISNLLRQGSFSQTQASRLVFALLEQRVITLSLGEAAPAWRWKAALADFESQVGDRRVPASPAASRTPSPLPPVPQRAAQPPAPPAPSAAAPAPAPARAAVQAPVQAAATPAPDDAPPAPPPSPVTARGPEAQECFDLAVSAVAMGEISTAIGLLRRGLQLSPRDPEISALLGQLAFRDRQVGER